MTSKYSTFRDNYLSKSHKKNLCELPIVYKMYQQAILETSSNSSVIRNSTAQIYTRKNQCSSLDPS